MKKKIVLLLMIILSLTGCTKKNNLNGEVNVLNWSSYIPDEIIADFEAHRYRFWIFMFLGLIVSLISGTMLLFLNYII